MGIIEGDEALISDGAVIRLSFFVEHPPEKDDCMKVLKVDEPFSGGWKGFSRIP